MVNPSGRRPIFCANIRSSDMIRLVILENTSPLINRALLLGLHRWFHFERVKIMRFSLIQKGVFRFFQI